MLNEPIIRFENISKNFFGINALSGISLKTPKGKILGLIGENGAGKSTLMNILGGVITPDSGKIVYKGQGYNPASPAKAAKEGIAFIHQELNLFGNLSIVDNLFIDGFPKIKGIGLINRAEAIKLSRQALDRVKLNCNVQKLVEDLTVGQQQLVEIAKAFVHNSEVIIFDEPTSSLTENERKGLFELMESLRQDERTLLFISHNLDDVLRMSDQIAVLRDGKLISCGLKKDYNIDRMITEMVGKEIKNCYPKKKSHHSTDVVLEVRGLSQKNIIEDISFDLHKGEILGVFGLMGSGRSEMANIIFGMAPCQRGTIKMSGKTLSSHNPTESIQNGLAYVTENRRDEGLLMQADIESNIVLAALKKAPLTGNFTWTNRNSIRKQTQQAAENLQIQSYNITRQPAKNLSGGNQQKVVIAKWILTEPKVLILDEPTRGIDIGAKYEVYSIIDRLAFEGTGILCICSELEELMAVCDRILVMSNGKIHGSFEHQEFDKEKILHAAFKGHISPVTN